MKTKHTKGKLSIIKLKYQHKPKEIITGIGISEHLNGGIYSNILFNTILPETDKEYIKQHDQIKSDCERVVKCWNMHDELVESLQNLLQINESNDDFDTKVSNMVIAIEKAKQLIKKATS